VEVAALVNSFLVCFGVGGRGQGRDDATELREGRGGGFGGEGRGSCDGCGDGCHDGEAGCGRGRDAGRASGRTCTIRVWTPTLGT
jgi:hypothetical protein